MFRLVGFAGSIVFLAYGAWVALTSDLSGGAGMALLLFPFGAALIFAVGAVPYSIAQLFLSAKRRPERRLDIEPSVPIDR
jgi:hypothetical protein